MSYQNRNIWNALQSINIVSAFAMMLFALTGFIMTGIAGTVVEYLHTYQFLPLALSFGALALAFASSDTRDPRYYHPVEWGFVLAVIAFMALHAFVAEVADFIAQHNPVAGIVVVVIMALASAIVAR